MSLLTFKVGERLGVGGYALVFNSEESPGIVSAAIKKSRISLRVKRTILRHEARVLQLLQGHPAIPMLFGYQRVPHFEYIAIARLGRTLRQICTPGHSLKTGTVACIAEQLVSALEHLNAHGIVHRDIKPENILLQLTDPSRVSLIDFGIARKLTAADTSPKHRYNPIESQQTVIGTLHWSSINAHLGFDLRTYDDLESVAYTLLYLLMGDLPWRISFLHDWKQEMTRILTAKQNFITPGSIPVEFRDLLNLARTATGDITGDLAKIRGRMHGLASDLGEIENNPLDLTLEDTVFPLDKIEVVSDEPQEDGAGECEKEPNEEYSVSYVGWDIDCWDMRAARDKSLTFPTEEAGLLDGQVPDIIVLDKVVNLMA